MIPFKDNFSRQSAIYAKYRPHYPEALYSWLASLSPAHSLAWDCGTGNGQAANGLSSYFKQVIATDPSAEQIRHAVHKENIVYKTEKGENVSLPDHSVDLVTVANAMHWFDFDAFYKQVNRVLKADGILAAWACGLPVIDPAVDAVINAFHYETLDGYWLPENQLVVDKYKDVPFPFEQIASPSFSALKRMNLDDLVGFLNTWSAVQRYIAKNGHNPASEVRNLLSEVWGNEKEKEIKWELIMRVGKKTNVM